MNVPASVWMSIASARSSTHTTSTLTGLALVGSPAGRFTAADPVQSALTLTVPGYFRGRICPAMLALSTSCALPSPPSVTTPPPANGLGPVGNPGWSRKTMALKAYPYPPATFAAEHPVAACLAVPVITLPSWVWMNLSSSPSPTTENASIGLPSDSAAVPRQVASSIVQVPADGDAGPTSPLTLWRPPSASLPSAASESVPPDTNGLPSDVPSATNPYAPATSALGHPPSVRAVCRRAEPA